MKTVGTLDAPSQVHLLLRLVFLHCLQLSSPAAASGLLLQAQHNKLLAEFSAQNYKDPQKLLVALEDLDQVC